MNDLENKVLNYLIKRAIFKQGNSKNYHGKINVCQNFESSPAKYK